MGYMSKPLMTPDPKRRDRRAGVRSAFTEDVRRRASIPWRRDAQRPKRSETARRRSYERLLARYAGDSWSRIAKVLVACALVGAVWVAGRAAMDADNLVEYDRSPDAYGRLVELFEASCQEGRCGYARASSDRPSAEARALISRVRARGIHHDSVTATTTFRGGYGAAFTLVYTAPESPSRSHPGASHDRSAAHADAPRSVSRHLGNGWTRIEHQ